VNTCFAPSRWASLATVAAVALASTLVACSSGSGSPAGGGDAGDAGGLPPAAPQTYVGTIDKTDAAAGLVSANGSTLLFFCGGPQTYTTLTHWMQGSAAVDGPFTLTDGTWTAKGQPSGGGLSGTIDPGGGQPQLTWSVRPVIAGTLEGLYDAQVDGGMPTLIVMQPSASTPAAGQGAFRLAGAIQQVVPLMPIAWVAGEGIGVNVTVSGAMQEVFVTRAQP
jgi:hypothetical protein